MALPELKQALLRQRHVVAALHVEAEESAMSCNKLKTGKLLARRRNPPASSLAHLLFQISKVRCTTESSPRVKAAEAAVTLPEMFKGPGFPWLSDFVEALKLMSPCISLSQQS